MAFVINVIKMAPVDSRDYVGLLREIYYSVLVRNIMWLVYIPSKQETLTQCWSNAGPPSATLAQHHINTGSTPRVARLRVGLLVVTTGGEYKTTPTQCLLNARPASPVLRSIHSALVSTSCWYLNDALNQSWVNVGPPCVTLAHITQRAHILVF